MTEAEWLAAKDSWPMLLFLESRHPIQRKLRLFVCACCRRFFWDTLGAMKMQETVLISEQFADGLATQSELGAARKRLSGKGWDLPLHVSQALWAARIATGLATSNRGENTVAQALWAAKYARGPRLFEQLSHDEKSRVTIQCDLLRDLFAPFTVSTVDPYWLAWEGSTSQKLAQAIYDDRAFDLLPILADALEEAGCTDAPLLGHCRSPGPHVRGCWVIDLLLGKS